MYPYVTLSAASAVECRFDQKQAVAGTLVALARAL
jgi:hypothetical protein